VYSFKPEIFGKMKYRLSRSSAFTKLALKMRDEMDGLIASHLNDGIDMSLNGELWLIDCVAPKAKIFVDVGANVGVWSKMFLSKMIQPGKGLLFEPSPLAVARLRSNLEKEIANNRIEIIQAAVCEQSGTMDFYMEESAGETSSLVSKHSNPQARKISVDTTSIDSEMATHGLKFVDFLKIDAEGYDLHVLKSAEECLIEKRFGVIQFEYNKPWANSSSTLLSAIEYLEKYGYVVYLLKQKGLYNFNYTTYGEYYFYSNFVAITPGYLPVTPLSL
jgi:FkbM family methyltransferase